MPVAIKERPILFTAEMVRAILDGRKTQTRRVIRFRQWAEHPVTDMTEHGPFVGEPDNLQSWTANHRAPHGDEFCEQEIKCPYGLVGDRLWVRETFSENGGGKNPKYRADGEHAKTSNRRWKSGRFMPRYRSRILLEVVSVRVERVQEITEKDARAEGCNERPDRARHWFCDLWDSLNAKRGVGWDKNPWVFVIEFRKIS
jgi:hypothetical protein